MDDLISRDDVIDAVTKYCKQYDLRDLLADIECLQATKESERKTGKWIATEKGLQVTKYECSICKRLVIDDTGYDVAKDYPYCHCGADMRGDEE